MSLTLIGLFVGFIGGFGLTIETISGVSIRPKIYHLVCKKVYESHGNGKIVKIRLNSKEIRFIFWAIAICLGFILQLLDFFV